jgi:hypothetical protein
MSALGQKRTGAAQKGDFRFTPIATAKANSRKRSCLLYPRKRTCAVQTVMSALGQKRTFNIDRINYLAFAFDALVRFFGPGPRI